MLKFTVTFTAWGNIYKSFVNGKEFTKQYCGYTKREERDNFRDYILSELGIDSLDNCYVMKLNYGLGDAHFVQKSNPKIVEKDNQTVIEDTFVGLTMIMPMHELGGKSSMEEKISYFKNEVVKEAKKFYRKQLKK